jgi:hypothetical protein
MPNDDPGDQRNYRDIQTPGGSRGMTNRVLTDVARRAGERRYPSLGLKRSNIRYGRRSRR